MYSEPFTWLFRTLDTYPFTVLSDLIFVDQEVERMSGEM